MLAHALPRRLVTGGRLLRILALAAALAGQNAVAAPLNIAPDGDPFLGAGSDLVASSDAFIASSGSVIVINDQDVEPSNSVNIRIGRTVDTFTGDAANASRLLDYVGILFDAPQNGVNAVRVQNFAAANGGWWGPNQTNSPNLPLAAGDLAAPTVQVTSNGGASWSTVASTSDYVAKYTGVVRGTGVPFAGAGPLATFSFASQSGINGIRLIGNGGGDAGTGPGFIGMVEMEVLQDLGVVFPTLNINTSTGAITLNTGAGAARGIQGYSITSSTDVGALKSSSWLSVADNYDAGHPGANQVDANDQWTELSPPASRTELSEEQFGGDGGLLTASRQIPLGNAWIRNPFGEDLAMQVQLADGRVRRVEVTYNGAADNPLAVGDLNFDGQLTSLDWPAVRDNYGANLAALTKAERYGFGDLNNDGLNNKLDFAQFKTLYDVVNGVGSFAQMVASIPEPSSIALVAIGGFAALASHRRGRRNDSIA